MQLSEEEQRACDALLHHALAQGADKPIEYTLSIPKWQFLCYVAERHGLALHGSSNGEITRFEPNQPSDFTEFGAQLAVYAAADGIWPIYFAIVDRQKSPTLCNACVYVEQTDGTLGEAYYFFSISRQAIDKQPYRAGVVYLLERASFVRQPRIEFGEWTIHTSQLASPTTVTPLAKLTIEPEDFPFLAQMRTHDDALLGEYAEAMGRGLPLPE